MRKPLGAIFVLVLLVPALVAGASGGAGVQSYEDRFDEVSYSGSNGSLEWSAPWVEGGESNGPGSGGIKVVSSDGCSGGMCLEIHGKLLGGLIGGAASVRRPADLAGLDDSRLHFRVTLSPGLVPEGTFYVEARGNGSGWVVLADYDLYSDAGTHTDSVDVSSLADDDFEVRFRLSQLLLGDRVNIDDVRVTGSVPTPTTTTTSTTTSTTSTTTTTPVGSSTSTTPGATTSSTTSPGSSPPTTTSPGGSGPGPVGPGPVGPGPVGPAGSPTTTVGAGVEASGGSPTTTPGASTTSTEAGRDAASPAGPGADPPSGATSGGDDASDALALPEGSGLRLSRVGLLADYTAGMMGDMGMGEIEVLGVSLEADFSMAVEAFEATRLWIAALALVIAAALVSGMDIRRSRRGVAELTTPDLGRGASGTEE